jgi:SAM-dependent methyltransferase
VNYRRLYEYRFRDVDQRVREDVWAAIAAYLHDELGRPERILDPAAGRGEFIKAVPARERWAVDAVDYEEAAWPPGTEVVRGDIVDVDLPADHFDAVLVSNFLEHLPSPVAIAKVLERMWRALRPGGRIAVLGPNFRYCAREYFDCADHVVALTHVSVAEHLYATGFEVEVVRPRFLPYSFRGPLPASGALTRLYLRAPVVWRVLGKQYLVLGRKPTRNLEDLRSASPVRRPADE